MLELILFHIYKLQHVAFQKNYGGIFFWGVNRSRRVIKGHDLYLAYLIIYRELIEKNTYRVAYQSKDLNEMNAMVSELTCSGIFTKFINSIHKQTDRQTNEHTKITRK